MSIRVNIMGVDIDLIKESRLEKRMYTYLSNNHLNIVYLISTSDLERAILDEEYAKCLKSADLLLPGDKAIFSSIPLSEVEVEGVFQDYHGLNHLYQCLSSKKRVYLLCQGERMVRRITQYSKNKFPNLNIVGYQSTVEEEDPEKIVNNINLYAPDIVISVLPSETQLSWIVENAAIINAKLFLGLGDATQLMIKEYRETPHIVKMFGLEKLYKGMNQDKGMVKYLRTRIFRHKLIHYNNKKGEIENGSNEK